MGMGKSSTFCLLCCYNTFLRLDGALLVGVDLIPCGERTLSTCYNSLFHFVQVKHKVDVKLLMRMLQHDRHCRTLTRLVVIGIGTRFEHYFML